MKVILLTDVPKVGNRYDVKELKSGFAQNVLIARGLAILATDKALANLNQKKQSLIEKKNKEIGNLTNLMKDLSKKKIVIKVKSNDKGHLFESVGPLNVTKAIKDIANYEIDDKNLIMENIKELGEHVITFKKGEFEGRFKIEIVTT